MLDGKTWLSCGCPCSCKHKIALTEEDVKLIKMARLQKQDIIIWDESKDGKKTTKNN